MYLTTGLIAFAAGFLLVNGNSGCTTDSLGNWVCQAVEGIHYSPVGTAGIYQRITGMEDGNCSSETQSFAGPLSPLDEEVSMHFRGPLALKQFAVYNVAANATSTVAPKPTGLVAREKHHPAAHGHQRFHARHENLEKRADAQMVTAVIDGKVVEWVNNYFGPAPVKATPAPAPLAATVPVASPMESNDASINGDEPLDATLFDNGTYVRTGYYHAESGTAENLTFIGNYGGAGSGVFDETFGASTAYLSSDGTQGATGTQVLSNVTIPSDKEFAIFTGAECAANDTCGFVRPGSVAYHGFGGADKIFLFEFSMPSDGTTGFNADMPAIWMLNAQIPHTLQYGQADCSCWPACGEFDIMEVLSSGSTYCKSTLHTNTPGGDTDYIERPTTGTMKLAVLFHAPTSGIRIQVLPSSYEFGNTMNQTDVEDILNMSSGPKLSKFTIVA